MVLKEDACYYGTGSDCPATIDLYTRKRRPCLQEDIGPLAQFCDALPNIDFVMSFGIANDLPPGKNFVHQNDARLRHTKKPIIVTAHGENDMRAIIEMAAGATGVIGRIQEKHSLILYSEPLSPFFYTEMGISKCLLCCDYGIPMYDWFDEDYTKGGRIKFEKGCLRVPNGPGASG